MIKIPNSSNFMPIPIFMVNFIRNHFTKQRKIVERPRVILQLFYMQVTMRIRCVVFPLCVCVEPALCFEINQQIM